MIQRVKVFNNFWSCFSHFNLESSLAIRFSTYIVLIDIEVFIDIMASGIASSLMEFDLVL